MQDEITLSDIIKIITKFKRLIGGLIAASIIFALLFSLFSTKQYKASATILPLESSVGSLSQTLGALSGMAGNSSSGRLMAVLKSKTLAKNVINDLDLLKVIYKKYWDEKNLAWKEDFKPSLDDAAGVLIENFDVKTSKDGVLIISMVWDDPDLSAAIANAYVNKLSDFLNNRSLNISFQLVDPAVPPKNPFKPRLLLNTLLALTGSFFVGVVLAFFFESSENSSMRGK